MWLTRFKTIMPRPFTGSKIIFGLVQVFCARPNFFYILWQSQTFWRGTNFSQIFGLAQNIWTSTKHFGTCKRTRHKLEQVLKPNAIVIEFEKIINVILWYNPDIKIIKIFWFSSVWPLKYHITNQSNLAQNQNSLVT